MSDHVLEWRQVRYTVRQGFWLKPFRIIDGLNLSLPRGSVTGLIGPNGAGKTTTIKLGAGLLKADKGNILINGTDAALPHVRKNIGLLTENQYVYPYLRLKEWLKMLGELSGLAGDYLIKRMEQVLEMVALRDKSNALMRTLSKGQLQRAGIAQAFLHKPRTLLLDEPMSGLDPFWRYRVHQILSDYAKEGNTILFSSHIISDVLQLSSHIAVMRSGKLKWQGPIADIPDINQGLRAVIRTRTPDLLKTSVVYNTLEPQQDGSFVLVLNPDQKRQLFELASDGMIEIESMNPIYLRIEEFFHEDGTATD